MKKNHKLEFRIDAELKALLLEARSKFNSSFGLSLTQNEFLTLILQKALMKIKSGELTDFFRTFA